MQHPPVVPELFKGIALFTPGGDLIYCLDSNKQARWHLQLCLALQEILGLPEPPHFLVPGYTATIDRWLSTHSQQIETFAEVYPAVQRYQALLNAIFGSDPLEWRVAPWQEESCNPILLESYRQQFPQLWEDHELIVRLETPAVLTKLSGELRSAALLSTSLLCPPEVARGYILRLFVSGNSSATQHTLETIHQLLEQDLKHPYTLKVIDISKNPEQAESHQVSATPTLVRIYPQPVRRIVGELEDVQRVLQVIANH